MTFNRVLRSNLVAIALGATFFLSGGIAFAQTTPSPAPTTPPSEEEPSPVTEAIGDASGLILNTWLCTQPSYVGLPACQEYLQSQASAAGGAVVDAAAETIAKPLVTAIGEIIVKISTWFLGIAGVLLNFAVVKTVFGFSTLIGNSPGLLTAWGILRDIANMALLFGFIFLGLATILDLKKFSGSEAKKAIPRLLIFAVLMNFSLFGAQAVIDVSNAMSAAMYNQADGTCPEQPSTDGPVSFADTTGAVERLESCANNTTVGLAGNFIVAAGLGGMFDFLEDTGTNFGSASLGTLFVVYIGLSLFTIIAALVFLAAAIMLIIRAVVLTFLMVVAPLGFAALAIPKLENVGKDWWNRLIHQSFFAPILLLFLLVSLKITEGIGGIEGDGLAAVLTRPDSSVIGAVLVFAIVIGFLIASLIAAKKFGALGGEIFINAATNVAKSPLTAARIGGAYAGRNTLGQGAGALEKRYKQWAGRSGGGVLRTMAQKNILGFDSAIGGGLKSVAGGKYGGKMSYKDKQKERKERIADFTSEAQNKEREEELEAALKGGSSSDIAAALQKMSIKELEELEGIKNGTDKLVQNLSPEQFEKLLDSKELSEEQKDKIRDNRLKKASTDKSTASELKKWAAKDLEQLAKSKSFASLLSDPEFGKNLSDDQFDVLKKSGRLNAEQKAALQSARDSRFDPVSVVATLSSLTPEQLLKVSGSQLTKPHVAQNLSLDQIEKILDKGSLDSAQRTALEVERDGRFSPANAAAQLATMSSAQIAKLSPAVLSQPHVYQRLDVPDLAKIQEKGDLQSGQRRTIGQYIEDVATNPNDPRSALFAAYLNSNPAAKQHWGIS